MRVLSNDRSPPRLPAVEATPRCRPGERPQWVGLPNEIDAEQLRARAARQRVGVDALAGAVIEFALVSEAIARASIEIEPVLDVLVADLGAARLAPTPALRRWERSLAAGDCPAGDELPELCLPARILQMCTTRLGPLLVEDSRDAPALVCERAASRHGRTLEAHMLEIALSLA